MARNPPLRVVYVTPFFINPIVINVVIIVVMSSLIDIVVFGATGFTGRRVCRYLSQVARNDPGLTFGFAGRSISNLQELSREIGVNCQLIRADCSDLISINEMARSARIVINCVGPFLFTGHVVVEACVDAQTDYIDISGEPEYLEFIQLKFNEAAVASQTLVIGACGFDSIPGDMGCLFVRQELAKKGATAISSVECFIKFIGFNRANFGTYKSAAYALSSKKNLNKIRKVLADQIKHEPAIIGPKLILKYPFYYEARVGSWAIPFPGTDASVIRRTTIANIIPTKLAPECAQTAVYVSISSIISLFLTLLCGFIFFIFAKFKVTRDILLQHPRIFSLGFFSKSGPTEAQIQNSGFEMTFLGSGYSDKSQNICGNPDVHITAKLSGPNPGYVATPICCVQAALVLLRERKSLICQGGVLTPASTFVESTLLQRLNENGITFQVVLV